MKKLSLLVLLSALFVGIIGCGNAEGDLGTKGGEGAVKSVDDEIKRIQDDPNMPPQAKEIAIAQVKARSDAGKQMGEAMKNQKQSETK